MDLGSGNGFSGGDGRSGLLLSAIADDTVALRKLEVERLTRIVDWAVENTVDDEADAATITEGYPTPVSPSPAPVLRW